MELRPNLTPPQIAEMTRAQAIAMLGPKTNEKVTFNSPAEAQAYVAKLKRENAARV